MLKGLRKNSRTSTSPQRRGVVNMCDCKNVELTDKEALAIRDHWSFDGDDYFNEVGDIVGRIKPLKIHVMPRQALAIYLFGLTIGWICRALVGGGL